jgi:hypothetical protein
MIEFRGWSLKKTEEALFPSSQPLRWFAVRAMAAANSVNKHLRIMVPVPDPPVAVSGTLIPSVSLVFLEPSKVRK